MKHFHPDISIMNKKQLWIPAQNGILKLSVIHIGGASDAIILP